MTSQPHWSCPYIDNVIEHFRELDHIIAKIGELDLEDEAQEVTDELYSRFHGYDYTDDLERTRSINDDLRSWGKEQEDRADKYENEAEDLKNELSSAQSEIVSLEERIEQLEAQLEEHREAA